MSRSRTRWFSLLLALVALCWATEAAARVGGGQTFGGGGGLGGGGGGGFSGDGDLFLLALQLVIHYPRVGVPLLVVFVLFVGARTLWERHSGRRVVATHLGASSSVARVRNIPGLDDLRARDTGLSLPALREYLVLIHRRALEASATGAWEPLVPFVGAGARKRLADQHARLEAISEVVTGSVQVLRVVRRGRYDHLVCRYDGTRVEQSAEGSTRVRVEERWTFRRLVDATSLAPEALRTLGCPQCGASIETTRMGACVHCDTPIGAGQLQWQLVDLQILGRRPFEPPEVGRFRGGDEPSVHLPSIEAPDLAARLRELQGIHPEFTLQAFSERVAGIYHGLQQAWSHNRWQEARPWVTDPMYQSLRFWIEQYTAHGLRNQLSEVELERVRLVRIEIDAWYESITVRIWGSMKDAIVDRSGRVVGGNPDVPRRFSEYWTFLRSSGQGGAITDPTRCPSCGAPLDRIGQNGVCGYCESVVTTGRFDWVLSHIEPCETYKGTG